MARTNAAQLNIRSQFARDRVDQLTRQTGMTATQIVEEALRTYQPLVHEAAPAGLVRKGRFWVKPAGDRPKLTIEQAQAFIDESRLEREEQIIADSS
jgi:hypothetical protein